jgi:hypothetical protein
MIFQPHVGMIQIYHNHFSADLFDSFPGNHQLLPISPEV